MIHQGTGEVQGAPESSLRSGDIVFSPNAGIIQCSNLDYETTVYGRKCSLVTNFQPFCRIGTMKHGE
jgi:hypothetical protein